MIEKKDDTLKGFASRVMAAWPDDAIDHDDLRRFSELSEEEQDAELERLAAETDSYRPGNIDGLEPIGECQAPWKRGKEA